MHTLIVDRFMRYETMTEHGILAFVHITQAHIHVQELMTIVYTSCLQVLVVNSTHAWLRVKLKERDVAFWA